MTGDQIRAELQKLGLTPAQMAGIDRIADSVAATSAQQKVDEATFEKMSPAERIEYCRRFQQPEQFGK
jgi:hypothetical protein